MPQLNVEQSALTDARYVRLAQLAGYVDADHARGKMLRVWNECLERTSHTLAEWIIETHLGIGNARHLIPSDLATLVTLVDSVTSDSPATGEAIYRIHGTRGRIEWLEKRRKSARKAGKARAARAGRDAGRFTSEPPASRWLHDSNVTSDPTSPFLSVLSPLSPLSPDQNPETPIPPFSKSNGSTGGLHSKPKRKKTSDRTEAEDATCLAVLAQLRKWNRVEYTGTDAHRSLITARLREGYTELDLRSVIAYLADPAGKGWSTDEKMREHLCPETLFGPQKIQQYIDPARTWARRQYPEKFAEVQS